MVPCPGLRVFSDGPTRPGHEHADRHAHKYAKQHADSNADDLAVSDSSMAEDDPDRNFESDQDQNANPLRMRDSSPVIPTPASLEALSEEVWDQLAALRHDLLALVTVFTKVLNYFEAALVKRNAPEAEQRAALEGLLAAMRDVDASPSSSLDQVLSKFHLGLVKAIGREQ